MKDIFRSMLAVFLTAQLSFAGLTLEGCAARSAAKAADPGNASAAQSKQMTPLRALLQKPYVELFDEAPTLQFTSEEIAAQRGRHLNKEGPRASGASRITSANTENRSTPPKRSSKRNLPPSPKKNAVASTATYKISNFSAAKHKLLPVMPFPLLMKI